MNSTPTKTEDEDNLVSLVDYKANPKVANKEPPPEDWLSGLKSGSEFLARDRWSMLTPRWVVLEWIHGGLHPTGNVLLIPGKTPNDTKSWQWVDPVEFCKIFEFRGILWKPEEGELT